MSKIFIETGWLTKEERKRLEASEADHILNEDLRYHVFHVASRFRCLEELVVEEFGNGWALLDVMSEHGLDKVDRIRSESVAGKGIWSAFGCCLKHGLNQELDWRTKG